MKLLRVLLSVLAFPLAVSAQSVKQVTVACPSPTLALAARMTCTSAVRLANGHYTTTRPISWGTSKPTIALVSDKGIVSTVTAGSTTIFATVSGVTGSAALTVTPGAAPPPPPPPPPVDTTPASVTLSESSITLSPGRTRTLFATVKNAAGTALAVPVTFATDSTPVATVGASTGVVTAGNSAGVAHITGSITSPSLTSSPFTVTNPGGTPPPPPPPVPVANVSVSLGATSLVVGQTTNATAVARDSTGDVLTGRQPIWTSLTPSLASVSPSTGIVTALAAGTATISATVETKTGNATLPVIPVVVDTTTPPFIPPPDTSSLGHPHEPSGYTQLSPTLSGDTVPLTTSSSLGWVQRNVSEVTQVIDSAVPFTSKNVLNINFPSGMIGGGSPGVVNTYHSPDNPQAWPQQPTRVYYSYWYKLSPNFPINLASNKVTYVFTGPCQILFEALASADYPLVNGVPVLAPNQATQYDAALFPEMFLSGIVSLNGVPGTAIVRPTQAGGDPVNWPLMVRGRWQHYEFLYITNTPGVEDGTLQMWLDGVLVISITHIKYTDAGSPFTWAAWWPVYGGGGSIPADGVGGYHRLKDFYVSGKP